MVYASLAAARAWSASLLCLMAVLLALTKQMQHQNKYIVTDRIVAYDLMKVPWEMR